MAHRRKQSQLARYREAKRDYRILLATYRTVVNQRNEAQSHISAAAYAVRQIRRALTEFDRGHTYYALYDDMKRIVTQLNATFPKETA